MYTRSKESLAGRSQARAGTRTSRRSRHRWSPAIEALEDRQLLSLSVGTNFTGATIGQSQGFIPPDTQAAAGPTQIVETVNGSVTVYSKTGTTVSQESLDTFFNTALSAGGGGSVVGYSYDPRISYDPQSQRFFVAGDDNGGGVNSFLIAVSNSSDATAGWKAWAVASDPTGKRWMDYPTLGLNADGVYLGGNMFPISGSGVNTDLTDLLVIPKADLVSGVGVTHATLFANLDPNTTGFTPHPLVDLNSGEGQPETILSDFNTPAGYVKFTTITGSVTSPTLNTSPSSTAGSGFVFVPAQGEPDPAPQLGDSRTLDSGDTRFSSQIIEQGTNIWAVQAVDISGRAGIEWSRFSLAGGTYSLAEHGTIADSSLSFFYPSIAVNATGQILVGFSGSSPSTYAGDYAVTGTFDGTTTTFGSPQVIKAGTGPYFIDYGTGRNRWGDYSAVMLDPNDPNTFWSIQEWASTVGTVSNSTWSTQITAFGVQQTVTGVTSTTPNGTYGVGQTISVVVGFSNPVVVTGTPTLLLNSGGTASYSSGSGTNSLTFTYTVAAGQAANPLDEASSSALSLSGGTIKDMNSGVAALLTLPAPGTTNSLGVNSDIVISTSTAAVSGVSSSTPSGTYGAGATISITVTFSSAVNVTGNPILALNTGGTATYSTGSGTTALTFTYIVSAGQSANPLDDASTSALSLNGGTIDDASSSSPAGLTLPAPGSANSLSQSNVVVDAIAPTVTNIVSTTANGTYGAGAVITIDITFSKAVDVTGTPTLALNDGGTASYSSGNGTSTLVFTYTVASGQSTPKLDSSSSSALSGTITDTVAHDPNAAVLTVPTGASTGALAKNSSIAIDAIAPTVTNIVSTTANGTYGAGAVITIDITFSKAVDVTGVPTLALNDGGTASYVSGNGTSTLVFTYTVASGQSTPKLDSSSSSALSGTITDTVAHDPNAAVLTVPTGASTGALAKNSSIAIDAIAPTVTNIVSTTANGTYGAGAVITIDITFSKAVDVTGVPTLALNDGGTASYSSGNGTSTLVFTYTVASGQSTPKLDSSSSSALTGTITDTVANDPNAAVLTVPTGASTERWRRTRRLRSTRSLRR